MSFSTGEVFVDTSFWVAHYNRRDDRHEQATHVLAALPGRTMSTTNHVLGESWNLLRRRGGHAIACEFLDWISNSPRLDVTHISGDLELDAWRWLRRHDERVYSFVDATSFALMRSQGLREALAFDGDFSAAGFVELRA
jgi:uncharacterized protein